MRILPAALLATATVFASGCLVPDVNLEGKKCSTVHPCVGGFHVSQQADGTCVCLSDDGGTSQPAPSDGGQRDAGASACDLLAQTGCSTGMKCTLLSDGGPGCGPAGSGADYSACSAVLADGGSRGDDASCSAGTVCVDVQRQDYVSGWHCFPLCDASTPRADGGTTCPGANATCLSLSAQLGADFCDLPSGS